MQSEPTSRRDSAKRDPLPEVLRREIARQVRALDDERLLALVGAQLGALVAEHGAAALAPAAREDAVGSSAAAPERRGDYDDRPCSAPSSPAKPRPRRADVAEDPSPRRSTRGPAPKLPSCAPWKGSDPFLPWPRKVDGVAVGIDLAAPGKLCATIAEDVTGCAIAGGRCARC